jgi:hypothetical protein
VSIPVTIIPPQQSPITVTFIGRNGTLETEIVGDLTGAASNFESNVNDTHSQYLVRTSFSQFFTSDSSLLRSGNFTARKNRELS